VAFQGIPRFAPTQYPYALKAFMKIPILLSLSLALAALSSPAAAVSYQFRQYTPGVLNSSATASPKTQTLTFLQTSVTFAPMPGQSGPVYASITLVNSGNQLSSGAATVTSVSIPDNLSFGANSTACSASLGIGQTCTISLFYLSMNGDNNSNGTLIVNYGNGQTLSFPLTASSGAQEGWLPTTGVQTDKLTYTALAAGQQMATSSVCKANGSGVWYWEVTNQGGSFNNDIAIGVVPASQAGTSGIPGDIGGLGYSPSGTIFGSGGTSSEQLMNGSVLGITLNMNNRTVTFAPKGPYDPQGMYMDSTRTVPIPLGMYGSDNICAAVGVSQYGVGTYPVSVKANFGQTPFTYAKPAGAQPLSN
jgi:hypothetical protein